MNDLMLKHHQFCFLYDINGKKVDLTQVIVSKPYSISFFSAVGGGNFSRDSSFSYRALHVNESLIESTDAMWGRSLEFNPRLKIWKNGNLVSDPS